jgi:EAL domain-containing protein (putative c-di-GMP-specific phosphodiesterase class I)
VTIGIYFADGADTEPKDILQKADTAMYRAKGKGRSCFQIFDEAMHNENARRLELEQLIRHALERREFEIKYRPIKHESDRKVHGFEAIVAWDAPGATDPISPPEVARLLEATKLDSTVTLWCLDAMLCKLIDLEILLDAEFSPYLSLNLSTRQLADDDFIQALAFRVRKAENRAMRIQFHVSESVLHGLEDFGLTALKTLKESGAKLSLSGFGRAGVPLERIVQIDFDRLRLSTVIRRSESKMNTLSLLIAREFGLELESEPAETFRAFAHRQNYLIPPVISDAPRIMKVTTFTRD